MKPETVGQDITDALAAVAAALDAHDAAAAADATERLTAACAESGRRGLRLDAATLGRAQELLGRCEEGAQREQAALAASLLQISRSEKAHTAYHRR